MHLSLHYSICGGQPGTVKTLPDSNSDPDSSTYELRILEQVTQPSEPQFPYVKGKLIIPTLQNCEEE